MTASVGIGSTSFGQIAIAQRNRTIGGSLAPELSVPHWIDGQCQPSPSFSIAANREKWIYLKYFQDWCPACHSIGFPNLQELKATFPAADKIASAVIQTTFEGHAINTRDTLRKNQLAIT
jgi:hypothetical protein